MSVFGVGGIINHFSDVDIAAPGANSDILVDSVRPKYAGKLQVGVVLAVGSIFNVIISDGVATITAHLSSTSLVAGTMYTFTFPCHPAYSYNFQVETNGGINFLQVDELTMP